MIFGSFEKPLSFSVDNCLLLCIGLGSTSCEEMALCSEFYSIICDASVTESGVWSTSLLLFASSVTILKSMPCRFLVADCMIQCMQNGADTEGVHCVVVFIFSVSLLDASMCGLFCRSLWSISISFIFWCLILHFCLVCSNIHCIHTTHGSGMLFGFELRSLLSHNQQLNSHSQVFSFTIRKLHLIFRSTSLLPHSIQVCKHTYCTNLHFANTCYLTRWILVVCWQCSCTFYWNLV